jgi:signal transduction histidine kinase
MSSVIQSVPPLPETPVFDERFLARAFASFTAAAASLERSYSELQAEVARLRQELTTSHQDLARSRDDNRHMRQRLDRILAGLPCGVLAVAGGGQITLANPEARRLLGVEAESSLTHVAQLSGWREALGQTPADGGEQIFHCGEVGTWVALRRASLGAAEPGGGVFILRDVSEARRLEREREGLQHRQALADMSAMLAHEIRNPLASLELFAGLLLEASLDSEAQQWATQLQAGLRTLAATVNNVLQFHSRPSPQLVPVDLGRLLTASVQFLGPLAGQAGVRLELDQQLDGVQVAGDRHRLEQVLLNLALNAFRAMPQGGVLRIAGGKAKADSGRLQVRISDSGKGVAAADVPRIFDAGFTTCPGSPGLGLAVCRAVMEQHGGSIEVRTRPGSGTTFILEFSRLGASQ